MVRGYSRNVCKTERGIKSLGRQMTKWLLQETGWNKPSQTFADDAPPYTRISFQRLKPTHLITLAAPWLDISSENPSYINIALDSGFLGRTGQDLGLIHRFNQTFDRPDSPPLRDSRPILRLLFLPNSPAHKVVRRFEKGLFMRMWLMMELCR